MSENPTQKRTYNSTRRRQQASQTRMAILEAARKLFTERGYASATIEAIAEEAGVSPDTIYAVFGNKPSILRSLVQVTLVGDDRPVPLLERPYVQENIQAVDQRQLIRGFARDIYQIMGRMSPMFRLLRGAARADTDIAEMLNKLLAERLRNMSFLLDHLRRLGPLRELPIENQANVTVWSLSSGEMYDLLIHDLGWGEEEYISWLSDALERLLLP